MKVAARACFNIFSNHNPSCEMKTRNILLLISAAVIAASCSTAEREVKMMSYSVNNCFGLDSVRNVQRIADIILSETPDVVALQDVYQKKDQHLEDLLAELAELTSMVPSYGNPDAEGNAIAILSKEKPLDIQYVELPGPHPGFGLLVADFKKFMFGSIFMSGNQDDQIASTAILKEEAAKAGKPFFFGGNLNAKISSPTISNLSKDFTALTDIGAKSYPADQPAALVDYIFMYNRNLKSFSTGTSTVLNEPVASNHRPVVTNISFR